MMMDSIQTPMIQMRDVVKAYTTGDGFFYPLKGISLDIFQSEFLGITGKSGAGKTTLLNMISGVSSLTSGEISFNFPRNDSQTAAYNRIIIHELNEDQKARWRGKNLGIVYQSFELMPNLNLVENVMLPQDFAGIYHPVVSKNRALELLEMVEIAEHAYKIPAHISGGQKQRVAIARALVNDPLLIIADEPTGNLDTKTAGNILQIFKRLVDQGKTVVMVTHDESMVSQFSRCLRISDGKLVEGSVSAASLQSGDRKGKSVITPLIEINISTHSSSGDRFEMSLKKKNGDNSSSNQSKSHAIILENVNKTYENAAGKFTALKGINLAFNQGEFISIVGKSGCGKSTLLNMITGIDHPTSGKVVVGGKNIYEMTESERAHWRGRNMGVVFQFFQLLPTLTLLENTMLPMDFGNFYNLRERPERALELLKMVGLEEHAHKLPSNVSNGQQQSAAIARALANDPAIILADEPTGNLDSKFAATILDLFNKLAGQGKTILIVSHDPALTKRTDRTVILSDGEIIDETVARTLPFLDHQQMLTVTHNLRKHVYPPGSSIIYQGEPIEHFYMIDRGEVAVTVNTKIPKTTVKELGPGQFFGEVSLTLGGNSINGVRASDKGPVELSTITKREFLSLIRQSPQMESTLQNIAHYHMIETQNLLRGVDR